MARTKQQLSFLPEAEIQQLEAGLASGELNTEDLGQNPELPRMFERLLRSYRLAANVANGAWFLVQSAPELLDGGVVDRAVLNVRALALQTALHDYAPAHFPRVPPNLVDALELIYNEAAERRDQVSPEFLDWFFDAIQACRRLA